MVLIQRRHTITRNYYLEDDECNALLSTPTANLFVGFGDDSVMMPNKSSSSSSLSTLSSFQVQRASTNPWTYTRNSIFLNSSSRTKNDGRNDGRNDVSTSIQSSASGYYPTTMYSYNANKFLYNTKQQQQQQQSQQQSRQQSQPIFIVQIIYTIAIVSWMVAYATVGGESWYYSSVSTKLELHVQTISNQMHQIYDDHERIREQIHNSNNHLQELKDTRIVLMQELQKISDMVISTTSNTGSTSDDSQNNIIQEPSSNIKQHQPQPQPLPAAAAAAAAGGGDNTSANSILVQKWKNNRIETMIQKIKKLQRTLQEISRRSLQEQYGDGPYLVRFTVVQASHSYQMEHRTFIVELASIDSMPVSVQFFLETVSNQLWDDTVLLHHENIEHVIAIAPIDYKTQLLKQTEIQKLSIPSLPFPEYSEQYTHKQYTIGFARNGPTFYINTVDNSKTHGPNGQSYHLLQGDADPCFGTIVQGTDVIDDMIQYSYQQRNILHNDENDPEHPWINDVDYAWYHLTRVEIITTRSTS